MHSFSDSTQQGGGPQEGSRERRNENPIPARVQLFLIDLSPCIMKICFNVGANYTLNCLFYYCMLSELFSFENTRTRLLLRKPKISS